VNASGGANFRHLEVASWHSNTVKIVLAATPWVQPAIKKSTRLLCLYPRTPFRIPSSLSTTRTSDGNNTILTPLMTLFPTYLGWGQRTLPQPKKVRALLGKGQPGRRASWGSPLRGCTRASSRPQQLLQRRVDFDSFITNHDANFYETYYLFSRIRP
jgi:hypothetical protein